MSKENKKTLEVYKEKAYMYLANSAEHDRLDPSKAKRKREKLEKLIKESFSILPENSKVFEIGSGDGTNAKFIESLGFEVTASDTADDFIKATQSQGIKTIKFDAIEDEFPEKYFGIFCWRVFVHFTKEDALFKDGVYHETAALRLDSLELIPVHYNINLRKVHLLSKTHVLLILRELVFTCLQVFLYYTLC